MSYQDRVLSELKAHTAVLATISRQLDTLASASTQLSPNYRRRLKEYERFNFSNIGATVVAKDDLGPAEVEWQNHRFDRATGEKFDSKFVIFSRPGPGCSKSNPVYHTLIRFADYNNTPLIEHQPEQTTPLDVQAQTNDPDLIDFGTHNDVAPSSTPAAEFRAAEARRRRSGEIKQPDQPENLPEPASVVEFNPREAFYKLAGDAMAAKEIAAEKINELVGLGDFAKAYHGLQEALTA